MNYMDYGRDVELVMFSQEQVKAIKDFLVNGDVFNTDNTDPLIPIPPIEPTTNDTGGGLQPWEISLIVIGVIALLALVIGLSVRFG